MKIKQLALAVGLLLVGAISAKRPADRPEDVKRLMQAAKAGDTDTIDDLVEGRVVSANARSRGDGETALVKASKGKHLGAAKRLIELGADPDASYGPKGKTAHSAALKNNDAEMAALLQEASARNAATKRLMQAASAGNVAAVHSLITSGATHVNARSLRDRETALIKATKARTQDVVANQPDLAARLLEVVKLLIALEADVDASYRDGKTAHGAASRNEDAQVAALLKEASARQQAAN